MIYTDEEIWIPVKGFEDRYQISNHGRLKSFTIKMIKSFPNGYILKGTVDSSGYLGIMLGYSKSERYKNRIHVLVGEHFIPKNESGLKLCINHLDGNKLNNHWSNLEWITLSENVKHAVMSGLFDKKGEKHTHAKLTNEKVLEMRRLRFKEGLTHQKIADMFGVCRRQAGDVINGINWGWLK